MQHADTMILVKTSMLVVKMIAPVSLGRILCSEISEKIPNSKCASAVPKLFPFTTFVQVLQKSMRNARPWHQEPNEYLFEYSSNSGTERVSMQQRTRNLLRSDDFVFFVPLVR